MDIFYSYEKWYVLIKILFLFVNTDVELTYLTNFPDDPVLKNIVDQLKWIDLISKRYKHFEAWITDNSSNDSLRINTFIDWFIQCDLMDELFVDQSVHLTYFNEIEIKEIIDDIANFQMMKFKAFHTSKILIQN